MKYNKLYWTVIILKNYKWERHSNVMSLSPTCGYFTFSKRRLIFYAVRKKDWPLIFDARERRFGQRM